MRTIIALVLAFGFAQSALALPPTANACNTPAASHNPHCMVATTATTVSVPEPSSLGLLGVGVLVLYLTRRRRKA